MQINGRENQSGNHEWTIQGNWQHRVHKTLDEDDKQNKYHNIICGGDHSAQANKNNTNKT